mgnify:CR=1 FL=1
MNDKKTVLIIDDDPDTVTYFSSVLEDNGYAISVPREVQTAGGDLSKIVVSFPNLLLSPLAHLMLSQAYLDLKKENEAEGEKAMGRLIMKSILATGKGTTGRKRSANM